MKAGKSILRLAFDQSNCKKASPVQVVYTTRIPYPGSFREYERAVLSFTVLDPMTARGAHLIFGPRGEALIRSRRSFERGHSLMFFQKT